MPRPPSALEELTARASDVTKAEPDAAFEFGLDVVLAGLEIKLAEAQKRRRARDRREGATSPSSGK
jgi:hypothetical protein